MPKIIEGVSAVECFFRDRADKQALTRVSDRDDALVIEKRVQAPITSGKPNRPSVDEVKRLVLARGLEWKDEHAERTINVWASDERVDRDGDIVRQDWNFDNFDKNPLVLFGHEWHMPPIGTVLQHEILHRNDTKDADFEGPALKLTELFATKDVWEWADTVFRLVDSGFMRSGSVGFFPGRVIVPETDEERAELGLGSFGAVLEENELIEHSIVSVPANPGAHQVLAAVKAAGRLEARDLQVIRELKRRDMLMRTADPALWKRVDSALTLLWKTLFPRAEIKPHKDIECPLDPEGVKMPGCCGRGYRFDKDAGEPIALDLVLKPFPNEHACRVRDPGDFQDDSFRRISEEDEEGRQLDIIIGRLTGETTTTTQAFRYPIDDWTEDAANAHCDDNDGILFEPAEPEEEESADDMKALHARMDEFGTKLSEVAQAVEDIREGLEESGRLVDLPGDGNEPESALAEILAIDQNALDKARRAAETVTQS